MKTLDQATLVEGSKVLVRCDLDVPVDNSGKVSETFRLDSCIPTLNYLIDHKVFPVIMGHMGRPEGKYVEELSTKHLVPYFEDVLGKDSFELLENLRFDAREETGDPDFAKELSDKADMYVNESFATCHRDAASIVSITNFLPSYVGLRLNQEIDVLSKAMLEPQRPFVAIVGGAKIESKKPVISKFLQVCDYVLVGGKIGLEWEDSIPENLILPLDYAGDTKDIGQNTILRFKEVLASAGSVIWSGPLGYCEGGFDSGTKEIAESISNAHAHSIVGGGDTVAILSNLGYLDQFDFVSTGGSAMLQFLIEGTLPGIEALK